MSQALRPSKNRQEACTLGEGGDFINRNAMSSDRLKLPEGPSTYLDEVIRASSEWLDDERLSSLPTRHDDKDVHYNKDHMDTCKTLDAFVNKAGCGLRRLQKKELGQALGRLESGRDLKIRKTAKGGNPKYEGIHTALKLVENNAAAVSNDLLRLGGSGHVEDLQAALEALREEATQSKLTLLVKEGGEKRDMALSGQAQSASRVEAHELLALGTAKT